MSRHFLKRVALRVFDLKFITEVGLSFISKRIDSVSSYASSSGYAKKISDNSVNTRWFKYDRDWFVCKQAVLRSSCATL